MVRKLLASLALACACVIGSAPAAASDGESALSVSANYATYITPDYSPNGGVIGLSFERGFSDVLAWRIAGGGGVYYGAEQITYSGHATFGFTYLLDILKYVPYVEAGVGGILIAGGDAGTSIHPLIQVGVGLDILKNRTFSYGVHLQFETLLQQTSFFTVGARATWRWGFF